jgi:hypothetical protein
MYAGITYNDHSSHKSLWQDYRPRKKSIMQWLFIGSIACVAVIALVAMLHYGTEGHSAPSGHTSDRAYSPAQLPV